MSDFLHIDSKELSSIENFEWTVKSIANGLQVGKRYSKRLGPGMEFSQYRPYSQGDDLRLLDWKMVAKSDKYYVRQSEVESDVHIHFVIDTSRSMRYQEGGTTKLTFAKVLSGVLGFVAMENGDQFGLATKDGDVQGQGGRHWNRYLRSLHELGDSHRFEAPTAVRSGVKDVYVLISDLYEDEMILPFLYSLKRRNNEVVVFHVLGRKEQQLDFQGVAAFEDLEEATSLQLDSHQVRVEYAERLGQWKADLKSELYQRGIDYQLTDFTLGVGDVVNRFLRERRGSV